MTAKETAGLIEFDFGDEVEFVIKQGKDNGIVCEMRLQPGGVLYSVTWSDKSCKDHYGFELKKVMK